MGSQLLAELGAKPQAVFLGVGEADEARFDGEQVGLTPSARTGGRLVGYFPLSHFAAK